MTPSDELRELWQSDIAEAMNQRDCCARWNVESAISIVPVAAATLWISWPC